MKDLWKISYLFVILFFVTNCLYVYGQTKNNDTIKDYQITISLKPVYVYGKYTFKNEKQRVEYNKLVRDVRRTYPYAKFIARTIIETYEMMETLPEDQRQGHLEKVKKNLMDVYKPQMKKLTKRQGQILMKLINRETGSSSYEVVKAVVGGLQATTYNLFAGLFGNSLKVKYDPKGKDKDIEAIVININMGLYEDEPN